MAATIKILSILLFLCFSTSQGDDPDPCSLSDLSISQAQNEVKIQGKPEWVVTITNNCTCGLIDVKLNCKGFQTVEQVDPTILAIFGDVCLVNNGNVLFRDPITFNYAWDHSFPLNPVSASPECS